MNGENFRPLGCAGIDGIHDAMLSEMLFAIAYYPMMKTPNY